MSSLFGSVTRYPLGVGLNPRENRLTAATTAVLERVDGDGSRPAHDLARKSARIAHGLLSNEPAPTGSGVKALQMRTIFRTR
jgi:hypothetical protein